LAPIKDPSLRSGQHGLTGWHDSRFASAMQGFPLFLCLEGRRALVVGGTTAAARKIELLLAAGAEVTVIAEAVGGEVAQLVADRRVRWAGRHFSEADLAATSVVIVASNDEALQRAVSRAACARGVPVNVVDRPALSSFLMPAIVDRGPVTVAISTGGAAPALARKLRAEIERRLPAALGRVARFAAMFREQVRRTLDEPRARRRFWDRVFDGPVAALALAGDEIAARRALIRLLDGVREEERPAAIVHLVDAGGGDPDLLTLKAHRLLQAADAIVHDRRVPPRLLAVARRDAERFPVDEHPGPRLIALARRGRKVVWLGSGDAVGGCGGAVGKLLLKAGVAVEAVPGVVVPVREPSEDKQSA
jgi:uroporphyrin-III C-methyltransferase/precorrin-2 dehydrogenase/sirohydrochlorin ferrochelatase